MRTRLILGFFFVTMSIFQSACTARINQQYSDTVSPTEETAQTVRPSPSLSPSVVPATATTTMTMEPTAVKKHPVIIISWDGAPASSVYEYIDNKFLPSFSSLVQRGIRAEYLLPVQPPLTAPVHASLATGALPGVTGIIGNAFHVAVDNFYWYRLGYEEPYELVEPVWVTASKQGLITATAFFPGASPSITQQTADYTIGYGIRDAYSSQQQLSLRLAQGWVGAPVSYSAPLEAEYQIPEVTTLYFYVYDTANDHSLNYDQVIIKTEKNILENDIPIGIGDHVRIELIPSVHSGAEFLIQEIRPGRLQIYHTGVYHNSAAPRQLLEELNEKFGFFQAGADEYALEHGWIDESEYIRQLTNNARWMAEVTSWLNNRYQPDILFAWQELFDSAGHAFWLKDPLQPGYSPEKSIEFEKYYKQSALLADQVLDIILDSINLDTSVIIMVSDHGVAPVHTTIFINTILQEAGLLTLDKNNYVVEDRTKAFAVASGGIANIYIHVAGREKLGIVTDSQYSAVQSEIIDLMKSIKDPRSGKPVFSSILTRQELVENGLNHRNSGDIWVQANLGYSLDGWRGMRDIFKPTRFFGQHGYQNNLTEMHGIFIAAGYGVKSQTDLLPALSVLDIAPMIYNLSGIQLPDWIDREPILLNP